MALFGTGMDVTGRLKHAGANVAYLVITTLVLSGETCYRKPFDHCKWAILASLSTAALEVLAVVHLCCWGSPVPRTVERLELFDVLCSGAFVVGGWIYGLEFTLHHTKLAVYPFAFAWLGHPTEFLVVWAATVFPVAALLEIVRSPASQEQVIDGAGIGRELINFLGAVAPLLAVSVRDKGSWKSLCCWNIPQAHWRMHDVPRPFRRVSQFLQQGLKRSVILVVWFFAPACCFLLMWLMAEDFPRVSLMQLKVLAAVSIGYCIGSLCKFRLLELRLSRAHRALSDLLPDHIVRNVLSAREDSAKSCKLWALGDHSSAWNQSGYGSLESSSDWTCSSDTQAYPDKTPYSHTDSSSGPSLRTSVGSSNWKGPRSWEVQRRSTGDLPDTPARTRLLAKRRPSHIAESVAAEWHESVTVLFCDIVGFVELSNTLQPVTVMHILDDLYSRFDALTFSLPVYKVETVGDCYMAASGLFHEDHEHQINMVKFARGLIDIASRVRLPNDQPLQLRIGIHCGSVMSGMVGRIRRHFRLFGDTVNTASRMESTSLPCCVQVSQSMYSQVRHCPDFRWTCRGSVNVKGKGAMTTYFLSPEAPSAERPG